MTGQMDLRCRHGSYVNIALQHFTQYQTTVPPLLRSMTCMRKACCSHIISASLARRLWSCILVRQCSHRFLRQELLCCNFTVSDHTASKTQTCARTEAHARVWLLKGKDTRRTFCFCFMPIQPVKTTKDARALDARMRMPNCKAQNGTISSKLEGPAHYCRITHTTLYGEAAKWDERTWSGSQMRGSKGAWKDASERALAAMSLVVTCDTCRRW